MVLLLTSCGAGGGGGVCDIMRPIQGAETDDLPDRIARQILVHNLTYERLCAPLP
jgi:hypothetical protein